MSSVFYSKSKNQYPRSFRGEGVYLCDGNNVDEPATKLQLIFRDVGLG